MLERIDELPLILVSGQARSGTTVLTRAIGAHPQVLSNNRENVWLRDLMAVIHQTLQDPGRVRQMAVEPNQFLQAFQSTAMEMLFPDGLVQANSDYRALSTFTSLRDGMFEALPVFLPNFRLLNIVRNGVEVVASRLKHEHISKAGDFGTHCLAWAHSIYVVQWFQQRPEFKDQFFLVRHEQLLDPELCRELFGRIQYRFGLDRSEACAEFVRENFVSRNSGKDEQSPQTAAGAKTRQLAWQSWTSSQRQEFEKVCGSAMSELGYGIPW